MRKLHQRAYLNDKLKLFYYSQSGQLGKAKKSCYLKRS